jgi:GDPmannose 4,6-dehydratase
MKKKALITGITGQDGSYLAEFLISKGYEVHGLVRRASNLNTQRIDHLFEDQHEKNRSLILHFADLSDSSRLTTLLFSIRPDEIYHLAAQSHVRVSFDQPEFTGDVTGLATTRLLEAIRLACPEAKFYQASSSEMFGASTPPQNEETVFYPRSPYGAAKLYAYWITKNYREAYGLFAVNGILFNHESPRRGETFVTRKITRAVARISAGIQSEVYLGNLEARRDWGYAPEYVVAMWKMLQQDQPKDFVIGTGSDISVGDFTKMAFSEVGLEWEKYVRFDEKYLRPTEVDSLVADASLATRELSWKPEIHGEKLAQIMVQHDLLALEGFTVDNPVGKMWVGEIA